MGILEKISEIEAEIARTQKNKATEYHLGLLKGKLARFRAELLENQTKSSGGKGEGFDVMKSGDARVALIGFPSGLLWFIVKITLRNIHIPRSFCGNYSGEKISFRFSLAFHLHSKDLALYFPNNVFSF